MSCLQCHKFMKLFRSCCMRVSKRLRESRGERSIPCTFFSPVNQYKILNCLMPNNFVSFPAPLQEDISQSSTVFSHCWWVRNLSSEPSKISAFIPMDFAVYSATSFSAPLWAIRDWHITIFILEIFMLLLQRPTYGCCWDLEKSLSVKKYQSDASQ